MIRLKTNCYIIGINERIVPPPRLRKPAGVVPASGKDEVDIHGDELDGGYAEWSERERVVKFVNKA